MAAMAVAEQVVGAATEVTTQSDEDLSSVESRDAEVNSENMAAMSAVVKSRTRSTTC